MGNEWFLFARWCSIVYNILLVLIYRVTSPIDGRNLTGISSIRVMQPRDYKGDGHRLLRWTEMFLLQTEETGRPTSNKSEDGNDVTRLAEAVAKAK